ncbi:MAG: xanthine dehydrogenase family protein subunit M [Pirellulaceae bacterium]
MNDFAYAAPTTLEEAAALLAQWGARAKMLAGGTDILVQLREHLREAEMVVDVKKIPELTAVEWSAESGLSLGAAAPCYRIYEDASLSAAYGALADSTRIVGGWQIQSRASVGGNLCNSSPAADTVPPLIVHQAVCEIVGAHSSRELPAAEFCTGPGKNVLQEGELLVRMQLPAPPAHSGSAYLRFIPRNEMDIAVVGAASWVRLNDSGDKIEEARIALGAVAPKPVVADEASQWLEGRPATEESFAKAGDLARKVATPISDMRGTDEYRKHLVGVLVKRTLATAVERAKA